MSGKKKGGKVSLTAFEASWLRMVVDTNAADAVAALDYLLVDAPRNAVADPFGAWGKIIEKITAIAPDIDA